MSVCERCGSEDALNVKPVRVYESNDYTRLDLCDFCGQIPGGIMRNGDGVALAIVGNIIVRELRAMLTPAPKEADRG